MASYIIVTPRYVPSSNGIKTLHKICHTINQLGGDARILFVASSDNERQDIGFGEPDWTHPAFNTPQLKVTEKHLVETSYVIYPETIIGNPVQAKKVIRYFGNREGFCHGKMIGIGSRDFLVAHSIAVRKDAHYILFNSEINPVFHDRGALPMAQRGLDATYIGKGYLYGSTDVINNTLLIQRLWPPTPEQLALLLRNVQTFYTWDSWSSINVEAVLCGAIPFFLRYDPWTAEEIDASEIGYIPRLDLQHPTFDPIKFEDDRRAL